MSKISKNSWKNGQKWGKFVRVGFFFCSHPVYKMNLGQQSDKWNMAQKRSPYPISDCKSENEQINPNYLLH